MAIESRDFSEITPADFAFEQQTHRICCYAAVFSPPRFTLLPSPPIQQRKSDS